MRKLEEYATIDGLLDAWEKTFQAEINIFIRDGIVCETEYAQPHVLFIMRDMNSAKKTDLRKELFDTGSGWPT